MTAENQFGAASAVAQGIPINAVWFGLLRPNPIVDPVTGQPGMQPVLDAGGRPIMAQTANEASQLLGALSGGAIVMHVIIHVNPRSAAPLIRKPQ